MPLRATGLQTMVDPKPFSFADAKFLRTMLRTAGFDDVTIQAGDKRVSSGSLEAMAAVLLRVGPLGRILRENPDLRVKAEPRLRAALLITKSMAWSRCGQRHGSSRRVRVFEGQLRVERGG